MGPADRGFGAVAVEQPTSRDETRGESPIPTPPATKSTPLRTLASVAAASAGPSAAACATRLKGSGESAPRSTPEAGSRAHQQFPLREMECADRYDENPVLAPPLWPRSAS